MMFEDFIKKGQVRRCSTDLQIVKSIMGSADNDINFLGDLPVNDISARKVFSNYYDVMRSILEAIAILEGYKVYSHEAFTYFLKEREGDILAIKFDRLRSIRNKVNYYGKSLSAEEVKEYKEEMLELISKFKSKVPENAKT